jgi:hypothetical protein
MNWITERDLEILKLLLFHPFLTTEQVEMMVFANLKPSSWRNKANERLRRLYHSHCIDRWFPPSGEGLGSTQQHIVLDRAGAEILAIKYERTNEKSKFRKRVYIPQTYSHTLKIFDFEAILNVLNRQLGVIDNHAVGEVIRWKTEHQTRMPYINDRGQKGEVIPDAFCIYKWNARGNIKSFFIEFDNATMDFEQLKSKIKRYTDLYDSGNWKTLEWAKLLRAFPTVMVIMHTKEDIKELHKYVCSLKSNIRFLFTNYNQLIDREILIYESKSGKRREVLQDIKIKVLDNIYISSQEKGSIAL